MVYKSHRCNGLQKSMASRIFININIHKKSYIIKFSLSVCLCVSVCVSMFVRNRLQNHACYGDEAFAGDSVGLGLGQRLNFILKKLF